jgi:DNA-binding FrmR family transcriptional regulator
MFEWLFGNRYKELDEKTQKGFDAVKKDVDTVGKWIKHLDEQDKQLFDSLNLIKGELSSIREEIEGLREGVSLGVEDQKNKRVFEKMPVVGKQTAVEGVLNGVQTGVQTGNFHAFLKSLTANERLVIFTLLNSDMKLSYEDLALLLGKERATIRGQINAIKQKSESLIEEIIERNGKKRVFIPEQIKEKMQKYVKVRVRKDKKDEKKEQKVENE